jgi:outer membrane biogenesis lipoprotein LolB
MENIMRFVLLALAGLLLAGCVVEPIQPNYHHRHWER